MKRMDLDQMRIAMVEITSGRIHGSELKKKFPEGYESLSKQIAEIKRQGKIVEIPPEIF